MEDREPYSAWQLTWYYCLGEQLDLIKRKMLILGDPGIPLMIIHSRHQKQFSRMLTGTLFVMDKNIPGDNPNIHQQEHGYIHCGKCVP